MTARTRPFPPAALAVPLLLALASAAVGVWLLRPVPVPPEPQWKEAPARVVRMIMRPCARRNTGTCSQPVAEYTVGNETRPLGSRYQSRNPQLHLGDRVTVLYDPEGKAEPWLQPEYESEQAAQARTRRGERFARLLWAAIWLAMALFSGLLFAGILVASRRAARDTVEGRTH